MQDLSLKARELRGASMLRDTIVCAIWAFLTILMTWAAGMSLAVVAGWTATGLAVVLTWRTCMIYLFSHTIWNVRPVNPDNDEETKAQITMSDLCRRFGMKDVNIYPAEDTVAMAVPGLFRTYVIANLEDLELAGEQGLKGVLAHELGHVFCCHRLFTVVFAVSQFVLWVALSKLLTLWTGWVIAGWPAAFIIVHFVAEVLWAYVSRQHELAADRFGALGGGQSYLEFIALIDGMGVDTSRSRWRVISFWRRLTAAYPKPLVRVENIRAALATYGGSSDTAGTARCPQQ